jgi:hypothetical protein
LAITQSALPDIARLASSNTWLIVARVVEGKTLVNKTWAQACWKRELASTPTMRHVRTPCESMACQAEERKVMRVCRKKGGARARILKSNAWIPTSKL